MISHRQCSLIPVQHSPLQQFR